MSIEDLLKPRYKVIAEYPDSSYTVGHIIHEADNLEGATFFTKRVHKYPHIFQKLEWWQDRKIEDMPEYLIFPKTGEVYKPTRYFLDDGKFGKNVSCYYTGEKEKRGKWKGEETPFNLRVMLPATQTDYINYQNSLK